jgi:hypothetical protein
MGSQDEKDEYSQADLMETGRAASGRIREGGGIERAGSGGHRGACEAGIPGTNPGDAGCVFVRRQADHVRETTRTTTTRTMRMPSFLHCMRRNSTIRQVQ